MKLKAFFLLMIGLLQMSGDLFQIPFVKAVASAIGASPAPKVFSAVNGYETFSVKYCIEWKDREGVVHKEPLSSQMYAKLKGPYNRRNVYGAILAYGPILSVNPYTKKMFDSAFSYSFGKESPLIQELGIDPNNVRRGVKVVLNPIQSIETEHLSLIFEGPSVDDEKQ